MLLILSTQYISVYIAYVIFWLFFHVFFNLKENIIVNDISCFRLFAGNKRCIFQFSGDFLPP